MSEWKKEKLGDYVEVLSGFAFKSKDFTSEGVPVIKIKNISPPNVSLEDLSYVPMTIVTQNPRYILSRGDVLIAMTGSHINQIASVVGRVGRIRYDVLSVLNQRVGKIVNKDDKKSSLDFVYYYLSQYEVKVELAQKAGGAANQANISPKDIKDLMFPCPPVETQHRIATILSRYDSLIENYQKQIKLLEEAAQRLYKEWFIDLHFPGHENTKIVDGVPEGWEKKSIGEIGTVITGKTPSTSNKENYGGSIPFITIPDMHTGIYPVSSVFLSEKGAESQSKKYIPQGALIVSCIGTAGLVCITKERCQTNQQINSLILDDKEMLHYMYFVFLSLKEHLNNIGSNGATMTNVNKSKFEGIDIVVPSSCIIRDFSQRTTPYFENILSLQSQIRLLTEARDRFLPKLMSGEITV